ncbi:hypothetical protein NLJ89_g7471 [Agrocybe chaxingu]|uniref:Uncharacterized protein n=1 Tax=Agrocybe chaxingu TaxID=84603 RepID=A0A9W8JZ46_9AGAR|nr:hypothetical protein NLJ89_g7471 [Agrocybe chaxingu]
MQLTNAKLIVLAADISSTAAVPFLNGPSNVEAREPHRPSHPIHSETHNSAHGKREFDELEERDPRGGENHSHPTGKRGLEELWGREPRGSGSHSHPNGKRELEGRYPKREYNDLEDILTRKEFGDFDHLD